MMPFDGFLRRNSYNETMLQVPALSQPMQLSFAVCNEVLFSHRIGLQLQWQ